MVDKNIKSELMTIDLINKIKDTGDVPDKYKFASNINNSYDYPTYPYNMYVERSVNYSLRNLYVNSISWCLVNNMWVKELAHILQGKKCLEIYGGQGLLSHKLQELGIDIICTDNRTFVDMDYGNLFTEVKNQDALSAVKSFEDNTLDFVVASWIPYKDEICEDICDYLLYHQKNCKIVYIGEDEGGCTATDGFFDYVIDITENKPYKKTMTAVNKYFQRWYGIYDSIFLYSLRKPKVNYRK